MNLLRKIQPILLTSIITAVILIGIEEYIFYQLNLSTFLVGIVGGVLVGIILSLFGSVFLRFDKKNLSISILQFFSVTLFSIVVSVFIVTVSIILPHKNWTETIPAPDQVKRFAPKQNSIELIVQTETGEYFSYECEDWMLADHDCIWKQANYVSGESETSYEIDALCDRFCLPPFPGKTVEHIRSEIQYPDAYGTADFIRSKDGRIYFYQRIWNPLEVIYRVMCGLVIGFLVSIATNVVIFISRKTKRE